MDDINLQFPVVIEKGDIAVKLDNTQQRVSGTPLNDKLNDFWTKFTQLRNQYAEIDHEESAAIMNGHDEETVNAQLIKKALNVYDKGDNSLRSSLQRTSTTFLVHGVSLHVSATRQHLMLTLYG